MRFWIRKALGYLAMFMGLIGFIAATGQTDAGDPSLMGMFLGGVGAGAMWAAIKFNLLDDEAPAPAIATDLSGEPIYAFPEAASAVPGIKRGEGERA